MDIFKMYIEKLEPLYLGRHTESGVYRVEINMEQWMVAYPEITHYELFVTSPDGTIYPALTDFAGNTLAWNVQGSDTAVVGKGKYQIIGIKDSKAVKYSAEEKIEVFENMEGLTDTTEAPDYAKPWVEEVAKEAQFVAEAVDVVAGTAPYIGANGNWYTYFKSVNGYVDSGVNSHGIKGDKGDPGYTPQKNVDYYDGKDGKDGISPTIEIQTDKNGTHFHYTDALGGGYFYVKNGHNGYSPQKGVDYFDGENGKDGVSPTAKVVEDADGATVIVKDAYGETRAKLKNGKDGYIPVKGVDYKDGTPGSPGKDGIDGFTPTVQLERVTDGVKITAKNKDGAHSQVVNDGKAPDILVVSFGLNENGKYTADKTHSDVSQAVSEGKVVLLTEQMMGHTFLYAAEEMTEGENFKMCSVFVSATFDKFGEEKETTIARLYEDGKVELATEYVDEFKNNCLIVRVNRNGEADKTYQEVSEAVGSEKIVFLKSEYYNETFTFSGFGANPDTQVGSYAIFVSTISAGESKYFVFAYLDIDGKVVYRIENLKARTEKDLILTVNGTKYTFNGTKETSVNIEDEMFVINVDKILHADKTADEVRQAVSGGKLPVMKMDYYGYTLFYTGERINYSGDKQALPHFATQVYTDENGKQRISYAWLTPSGTTILRDNVLLIPSSSENVESNVFVVKLGLDEDYNFVTDKSQIEVRTAVAEGKAVIMLDVEVGTTLLYMGEGTIDGERCPFFVSPLSEVGMTELLTNVVYLKESGEVAYMGGAPINPLIIHYGDDQYTFDGRELVSLNIKDDVFVIRVDEKGKADQTQAATIAAKDAGKAVLLVKNSGEVYTFFNMNVHPDYTSDYCPVFTSAIYGDFGETKYRSLAYLLSDKTVVTRTEAINTSGGSGGTGSGLPATTDPHQMLVTDSDGKTVWEERTHYQGIIKKSYTCVSATGLPVEDGDAIAIMTQSFEKEVEVGETYKVTYNGVEYESQAVEFEVEGMLCVALGNIDLATEQGDNGMPFFVVIIPQELVEQAGYTALILALDGATTVDISITFDGTTEVVKKIPQKFLPEQKFGEVEDEVVFLPETTVQYGENSGFHFEQFIRMPEPGQSIIATFDGVDYECMVYRSTDGNYDIAFGDSKHLGGAASETIPFGIGIISKSGELYEISGASFEFRCGNSNEHTIKIHWPKGYVVRLKLDYMPKNIAPVWNVRSTSYDALVNGDEVPAENVYYSDLTPTEIIDLLKNSRIGGMMLYYWNDGDYSSHIVNINDIQVVYLDENRYRIEAFGFTHSNSKFTKWAVVFDPAWNTYQVSYENI